MSNRTPTVLGFMNRKFTYQETIDYIEQKLHEQGKTSFNGSAEMCTYRGEDDTRCGIGHIIPDNQYTSSIEWKGIDDAIVCLTDVEYDPLNPRLQFLVAIQSAHDNTGHDLRGAAFHSSLHKNFSVLREQMELKPFKVG